EVGPLLTSTWKVAPLSVVARAPAAVVSMPRVPGPPVPGLTLLPIAAMLRTVPAPCRVPPLTLTGLPELSPLTASEPPATLVAPVQPAPLLPVRVRSPAPILVSARFAVLKVPAYVLATLLLTVNVALVVLLVTMPVPVMPATCWLLPDRSSVPLLVS